MIRSSRVRMEAWRQWLTRREKTLSTKKTRTYYESRIPLTPTGLLMEGLNTQIPIPFELIHISPFGTCNGAGVRGLIPSAAYRASSLSTSILQNCNVW